MSMRVFKPGDVPPTPAELREMTEYDRGDMPWLSEQEKLKLNQERRAQYRLDHPFFLLLGQSKTGRKMQW